MGSGLIVTGTIACISALYLLREVLIMVGFLKGPLLHFFERYGDDEPLYYPWPRLLAGTAGLSVFLFSYVSYYQPHWFLPVGPALVMLIIAYVLSQRQTFATDHADVLLPLPRWYVRLREDTSRLERRRIAYMWLRLSPRTRLLLNSSDNAFFQWADLIIAGTFA